MNILSKIRELANLPIQIKFLQSKINNIEYSISNIEKKNKRNRHTIHRNKKH